MGNIASCAHGVRFQPARFALLGTLKKVSIVAELSYTKAIRFLLLVCLITTKY